MSQVKVSNKKTPTKQEITKSLYAATSLMLKDVNEASVQYKGTYTTSTNIVMSHSMAVFTAPLYLNEKKESTITNDCVNHNFQGWDGRIGLEITNNIYNNPLKLENKHNYPAGQDT